MKIAIAAAALSAAVAGPAAAQYRGPLTMICHPLLQGVPVAEGVKYEVLGRNLWSTSEVGRTLISTEGRILPLGRTVDRGVVTRTYASHSRDSSIVTRRVYWQTGAGPRRLRFSERYDFTRRRITSPDEPGDSCHANGR